MACKMSMYSTEINEVIDYSYVLGFKGECHGRAGLFVVILKKIGDFSDPSIFIIFFSPRVKQCREKYGC